MNDFISSDTDGDLMKGQRNFDFVVYILKPSLNTSGVEVKQTIPRSDHIAYLCVFMWISGQTATIPTYNIN